ncbi:hypothetical protein BK008_03530 [Methanobacterium sp. MZ-A1]|uniref:HTH cro/C1-type domain-containing protein n=1 Tax=Methanobacterium subterraneum TaxID=59277 RepID=A0A2H4VRE3_9EURY|nr:MULTISPECIES: XRE family transcriptional regulator [Methanobacterium]AUB57477.1 hypothetical protein BK008_03530 [Methanobacterium sp. MZ-A1]AUB60600.1 hypothetical protein BK009_07880 [Methanobacterium subterraneum]
MRTPKATGTNHNILQWARKNAGYSASEVAKKMDKKTEVITSWENGEDVPTFKQLSKLSKIYHYPSAFFFAEEVPEDEPLPSDYRTMPDRNIENFPEIIFEIKDAQERREIALELTQKLDIPLPEFDLECSLDDDPEDIAFKIREYLDVTIEEQLKWKKDKYTALNNWKTILESKGILIFQFTGISPQEIRAYAIDQRPLPVIGINTGDDPRARNFSIFHELAHIITGTSGVCDLNDRHKKIERFCDEVAAKFLVPPSKLLEMDEVRNHEGLYWEDEDLRSLGNKFGVSREVILISLVKLGKSTWNIYKQIKETWASESDEDGEHKIPYYIKVKSWNGDYYTGLVLQAYHNKLINRLDLSSYMGNIKLEHIAKMES